MREGVREEGSEEGSDEGREGGSERERREVREEEEVLMENLPIVSIQVSVCLILASSCQGKIRVRCVYTLATILTSNVYVIGSEKKTLIMQNLKMYIFK